jgi:integrase
VADGATGERGARSRTADRGGLGRLDQRKTIARASEVALRAIRDRPLQSARSGVASAAAVSYVCGPMGSDTAKARDARGAEGVAVRHSIACAVGSGGGCTCRPGFQAQVWSPRDRTPIRKTFRTLAEAKRWRQEAQVAVRRRELRAPTKQRVREAAEEWILQARAGVVRTRSGQRYKPSTLRGYELALRAHVIPELGHLRLSSVEIGHLQRLVDRLLADDLAASTARNAIKPLQALYRRAVRTGDIAINPTAGVALPSARARRLRFVQPHEAHALIAALLPNDRALWATALYGGLRRGELQALRWPAVDLPAGLIRVEKSWDREAGLIEPKSRAAVRTVPVPSVLKKQLAEHRLRQPRGDGFVFSTTGERPFDPPTIARRANAAWAHAELAPVQLHQCRHAYAAFMIAAGVNAKALSTYMGHSTISVTLDTYGHLLPGNEHQAATRLDAYLAAR